MRNIILEGSRHIDLLQSISYANQVAIGPVYPKIVEYFYNKCTHTFFSYAQYRILLTSNWAATLELESTLPV